MLAVKPFLGDKEDKAIVLYQVKRWRLCYVLHLLILPYFPIFFYTEMICWIWTRCSLICMCLRQTGPLSRKGARSMYQISMVEQIINVDNGKFSPHISCEEIVVNFMTVWLFLKQVFRLNFIWTHQIVIYNQWVLQYVGILHWELRLSDLKKEWASVDAQFSFHPVTIPEAFSVKFEVWKSDSDISKTILCFLLNPHIRNWKTVNILKLPLSWTILIFCCWDR